MCIYFNKVEEILNSLTEFVKKSFDYDDEKIEDDIRGGEHAAEKKENKNKQELRIINFFTDKGEEIYDNLNLSVISGSYVQNENFEDKIVGCSESVNNIRAIIPESEKIGDQIDGFFCSVILNSLIHYRELVHSFQVSITTPNNLFLLSEIEEDKKRNRVSTDIESLKPFSEIFFYNITISFLDKNFSLDTDILRDLLYIIHKLKKHKCKDKIYCKILIDKCSLLILKFKLKYDNEDLFKSFLISQNFTDEEFNPNKLNIEYLKDFQDIISKLYSTNSEESRNYFKSYYQKNQNQKKLTFTNYFILIRYFSQVEKNIKAINELIQKFKEQYGNNINSNFDKFSYDISINYLYNNRISFLTTEQTDIKVINELFEQIQQLQTRTGINNYFPFYKIARYYSDFITRNTNNKKQINLALVKLQEAISFIEKNLEWTNRYSIRPFQPNYETCCVNTKIEGTDFKIFIASAYVIPINYTYYKKELEKLKEEHLFHKSVVKINEFIEKTLSIEREETKKRLSKEHKYIEEAHDEVKESQKNNIQILSVFAALVIFAVGNMQVFKLVETLRGAIIFMLTLAYSLCLFAIVIWFIVSYKKVKMTSAHHTLIGILIIGLIFSGCVIFFNWGNTPIASPQINNKKTNLSTDTILPQNTFQINTGKQTAISIKEITK